ncbi:MAG: hypothetical protein AAB152_04250 [Candidatus Coatesbacteria bacterium]
MDILSGALKENEAEIIAGWVQALDKIHGDPFGGGFADPYKETRIAFQALLAILERNDKKPAEEQAARLVGLPPLRGAGVTATIRGYYALFEAVRPALDEAYPEGRRDSLPHDVERLRSAVGLMTGLLTAAHFAHSAEWQNTWDKMAFHGLKGPVARMTSELQALSAGAGEAMPHAFREVLRDALRSSRQLMSIVESLFAMHRLGEGLLDTKAEPMPISALFEPVTGDLNKRASADRKTLTWGDLPPGVAVCADREFMRRALVLVLQRALDETEPGGTIRVDPAADSGTVKVMVRYQSQDPPPPADAPEPVEYAFARLAFDHVGGRVDVTRDPGNVVSVVFRFPPAAGTACAGVPATAATGPAAVAGTPAAEPAPPSGIRIIRTGPATQASGDSPKPAPPPPREAPALGEGKPDDSARGELKIVRGGMAPPVFPENKGKPE